MAWETKSRDVHIADATARRCLCKWRRRPIAGGGGWSGLYEWNAVTHARFDALRAIANLDLVEVQSGRRKVLLPLLGWTQCMRGFLGVHTIVSRRIRGCSKRCVAEILRYERVRAMVVAAAIGDSVERLEAGRVLPPNTLFVRQAMTSQEPAMRQISAEATSNGRHPAQAPPSSGAPPPGDTMEREIHGIMVETTEQDDAGAGHGVRAARSDRALPHAPTRSYREHSTSRTRMTRDAAIREAGEVHMALLQDPRARDAAADRRSRKDSRVARDDALPDAIARPPRAHGDYERERERDRAPMPGPRQQPSGQSWVSSIFSNARDTSQAEIAQLRKLLHEQDARENELRTRLAETERRLIVVTRDLEESRSFVAKEDSDAKELIVAFNDINESVDDLAYLISEAFPKDDIEARLTSEGVNKATSDDAFVGKLFSNALRVLRMHDGTLEDVITLLIASLLHSLLYADIFRPWSPGLEDRKSDVIKQLYGFVCKREPQDRSARWRSMTYLDCHPERDDPTLVAALTESFFTFLCAVLRPLLPSSSTFDFAALAPSFSNRVSKIVQDAIRFQDKAKGTYLSFDYEVYMMHQHLASDRTVCEPADKPQRWAFVSHSESARPGEQRDVVLVGTSLGLRAVKGSADPQGIILRPAKVVVRGKAIVGRCTFQPPPAPNNTSNGDTPPPNHE